MTESKVPILSGIDSTMNKKKSGAAPATGLGPVRYGLPCANCRLYFRAELILCPICGCENRISP
jgi:hypothetical protein